MVSFVIIRRISTKSNIFPSKLYQLRRNSTNIAILNHDAHPADAWHFRTLALNIKDTTETSAVTTETTMKTPSITTETPADTTETILKK